MYNLRPLAAIASKRAVTCAVTRPLARNAASKSIRSISSTTVCRLQMPPDLDEEKMSKLLENPLVQKLSKSPKTMEALQSVSALLAEKGYTGDMGVMKQVKLMMDKEVRAKMLEVKELMDKEGIELRQEDMNGLFEVMGLNLNNKQ